jgi:serine/threonine protein kinase
VAWGPYIARAMKSWSASSPSRYVSRACLTGDESRRRFRKEALALAKLSHPHIAAVYDVGEQDGVDYIVMECVPGQTPAARC